MYNLHDEFYKFHECHVRVPSEELKELHRIKKLNIKRLKDGLEEINDEDEKDYKVVAHHTQGSTAMSTQTQNDAEEYDIDIAVVFKKDNIPLRPSDARKVVEKALLKKCTNFSIPPEAGTNAVSVTYSTGHHLDFAVYRESLIEDEIHWEHAGSEWAERNPKDITKWFNSKVIEKSPKKSVLVTVKPNQMRRIVRMLKMFCKSQTGWSMPGGLIVSTLVEENYLSNSLRDDQSFYDTIVAIRNRLQGNMDVYNPVIDTQLLTGKNKYKTQVKNLKNRLVSYIQKLDNALFQYLDKEKARAAWKDFFNHDYWLPAVVISERAALAKSIFEKLGSFSTPETTLATLPSFPVKVEVNYRGTKYEYEPRNGTRRNLLPKGAGLTFTAYPKIIGPFVVRWTVQNEGDEATEANHLTHTKTTDGRSLVHTESTSYRGSHKMICSIIQGGRVIAEKVCEINIR